MKTEISTARQQFADPELEALLETFCAEAQALTLRGQQDGRGTRPHSEGHWKAGIFNPLQTRVQEIVDKVQQKLQPIAGVVSERSITEAADMQTRFIWPEIDSERLKAFSLAQIMQNNRPNAARRIWRWVVHTANAILSLLDGCMAYDAFRNGNLPFLQSVLYGIGILTTIFIGSILLADYAMKAASLYILRLRIFLGCVLAAFLFALFSNARANNYNNTGHIDVSTATTEVVLPATIHVSGFVLFGMSFGLFLVALFFSMRVHKTKEEQSREQVFDDAKKAYDQVQEGIKEKIKQVQDIDKNKVVEIVQSKHIFEYAEGCKKRALSIAENGLTDYARSFLSFRNDNYCPTYFINPPQFTIRAFFDQVKTS